MFGLPQLISVGEDEWGEAMETIGIAKGTEQRIRKKLVNTLLEECDNILRSYYAQMGTHAREEVGSPDLAQSPLT